MKIFPDCFPCFFRQAVIALGHAGIAGEEQMRILRTVSGLVHEADHSGTPAHLTTFLHRRLREEVKGDPFRSVKGEYNRRALDIYDKLRMTVEASHDPLFTAVRLAIAGNIIDFGIFASVDVAGTIGRALGGPIAVDHYARLREGLAGARRVLYLLDNAGEIVFDRLLIEALQGRGMAVTAVVKGASIINDATMEDAREAGLDGICRVIDNGSDAVGTILPWCSGELNREFLGADLVISKGQGNYETLHDEGRGGLFFLFQAKCEVVARYLGVEKGAMLLAEGDPAARTGTPR